MCLLCRHHVSSYPIGSQLSGQRQLSPSVLKDPSRSVESLIDAFEYYLRRQGRADGTRVKYLQVMRRFNDWVGERELTTLTPADVDLFLGECEAAFEQARGRSLSRATVRGKIAALRSFFDYLERMGLLVDGSGAAVRNPMRAVIAPPVEQRANDFLTADEDAALLSVECSEQERIILWLLRWTGLRVSEACSLTLGDFDLSPAAESVHVRMSKTSAGRRSIPLPPPLVPEIRAWLLVLEGRGLNDPTSPFLATRWGTAMKPPFVWRVVKRVAARAGVRVVQCSCSSRRATYHRPGCPRTLNGENRSELSPHTLRRTYASHLINLGLRLEVVARLLGHSSTTVTERSYAQLMGSTIRRELIAALAEEAAH
jgi:integrase